jgi:hypothetical protein
MTLIEHIKRVSEKVKTWPKWKQNIFGDVDEYCPHCGYYCTGKTVFCTKGLYKEIE